MSECMTFPDTVEEFMDSYKIVDTEQVYTNGTEMVPIYRMKQWFEHEPEIIRCKDCEHWINGHLCENLSRFGSFETKADFYCGYGKRRS